MKVMISHICSLNEFSDAPDMVAVLLITPPFVERVLKLTDEARALEKRISGFLRMDVLEHDLFFVDANRLQAEAKEGQFSEAELCVTEDGLEALAVTSSEAKIEACSAFIEKERIGWEVYMKGWDESFYTGTIDREIFAQMEVGIK